MSADRCCNAQRYEDRPGFMRCELEEWHDGDHYVFDNTRDGITWPLSEEELRFRDTRRLAARLERILKSVDCHAPVRVSVVAADTDELAFQASACLDVRHLRAVLDLIERRARRD